MHKKVVNSSIYFLIYFSTTAIYSYVNTFLPIFFFQVLKINRVTLALVQFLSYSALIVKPLFAFFSDNYAIKKFRRKPYVIIGGYLLSLSFIAITLTILELFAFGAFLSVNFFASSLIDVAIKGMIVDSSPTPEVKNRKIFLTKIGSSLGAMFPSCVLLLFIRDIYSIQSWYTFLSFSFLFLVPLMVIIPFANEKESPTSNGSNPTPINSNILLISSITPKNSTNFKKSLVFMCLFVFLAYGDKLLEFPLEPWVLEKFGEDSFYLFSFFLIIGIFLNILGFVFGTYLTKGKNRKEIIGVLMFVCALIEIIFAFIDFFTFLILFGLIQIFAGIIMINLSSLILDFAKNNKILYSQIIASFIPLAVVVFVPLGTLLSNYFLTEVLFVISGCILLFSIIPLTRVKL